MAITIKSADIGPGASYISGTGTVSIAVNVAAGELLLLGLFGVGTINSMSEAMTNGNGNADLSPLGTGRNNMTLWLFHKVAASPITQVDLNVTGFYADVGQLVLQGTDLRVVDIDFSILQGVIEPPGEIVSLSTAPSSREGLRLAIGGGPIPAPF